jgi:phosphoesterase RecJ-like protein
MTIKEIASILKEKDNFEILTHNYPDGDCLGCGYGLCLGLQQLGKNARVVTTNLPKNFEFLTKGVKTQDFEAQYIISTDVADEQLLGCNQEKYQGKIDMCIDHHKSNCVDAPVKFVDSTAAAACEIIYRLLPELGVEITKEIANCLYTGISTDTGCFRFTNTTATTMRIAGDLLELGCDSDYINKVMFETKSKKRVEIERQIYDTMIFCADDKCAMIYTTLEMAESAGDDDLEGLASIPRQIEGVKIGITIREKPDGIYKVSVRTTGDVDACNFCKQFGGGGHVAASGCTLEGTLDSVIERLKRAVEQIL